MRICPICNKPYSSFEQYDPHECLSYEEIKKKIRLEALEEAAERFEGKFKTFGVSGDYIASELRALAEGGEK